MIQELDEYEADVIRQEIQAVIDGKAREWRADDKHYPGGALTEAVLKIDGMEKREVRVNGWAFDWWMDMECDGQLYTLSGSGWHGGHLFHRKEE